VLLHGPPGCSKTTLVKAAAHAAQANLFSLSGAELYSMYVGEGEAILRETFQRARLAAPSIIFFDEADAIAAKRGKEDENSTSNGATVGEKLLSTLLTEIDGLELTTGVLVLGATNRPEAIDAALMRPGRFDVVLYVPPPDLEGRIEVLRVHTRNMKLMDDVDLSQIAKQTQFFTGAELAGNISKLVHTPLTVTPSSKGLLPTPDEQTNRNLLASSSSASRKIEPFYVSLPVGCFRLNNCVLDSEASDNVMPGKVANALGLNLTRAFGHQYSMETKEVPLVGRIKDAQVAFTTYPNKRVKVTILDADMFAT
ncbi:hypothetical protein KI387_030938, partial [Taxus chinensis]